MPYTLTMATDQEPTIAADGVQDVPLTKARPLLTRLIEQALEDGQVSALTVRGRRRAYLVTPAFYEHGRSVSQLELDLLRTLRTEMYRLADNPAVSEAIEQANPNLHALLTTAGFGY